jgi:hypothetical protein
MPGHAGSGHSPAGHSTPAAQTSQTATAAAPAWSIGQPASATDDTGRVNSRAGNPVSRASKWVSAVNDSA